MPRNQSCVEITNLQQAISNGARRRTVYAMEHDATKYMVSVSGRARQHAPYFLSLYTVEAVVQRSQKNPLADLSKPFTVETSPMLRSTVDLAIAASSDWNSGTPTVLAWAGGFP